MKSVKIYFLMGWGIAPFISFVNKYIFSDWQFAVFLVVICGVDTLLGAYKAIKLKEFSSKGFEMVFKKIIIYTCTLITVHVLVHFSIGNKAASVFAWFDYVIFSAIMVREAISIFENIAIIDPDAFPKSILKYLKQFDSFTGEFRMKKETEEKEAKK
jgi:toxin secretion/phage lysis holin